MKILRLLEKEVVIKDSSDFYLIYFTQATSILIDSHDICWVFLLKQWLYARSQKDKKSIMIASDLSETTVHFKML